MKLESIADDLSAIGLGEDQAMVYVRLLQTGPARVGDISTFFECSRSTLYRLLDELSSQGYVTKSLERPTVYTAAAPKEIFEIASSSIDRERTRLATVREQRLEALETISKSDGRDPPEHHWERMEGTAKIYRTLQSMIEDAEESMWAASNHDVSMAVHLPDVEQVWRTTQKRASEDGLDVRLLFAFDEEPYSQIPSWIEETETLEFRNFQAEETIHFVLVDEEELLMWIRPAPLGTIGKADDVAVHTDAPGSVFAHRMLFQRLWAEGQPLSPTKPEVRSGDAGEP